MSVTRKDRRMVFREFRIYNGHVGLLQCVTSHIISHICRAVEYWGRELSVRDKKSLNDRAARISLGLSFRFCTNNFLTPYSAISPLGTP